MKEHRRTLSSRLMILGAGSAVITAAALVLAAYWQSGMYAELARKDVDSLIVQDLDHITGSVYSLVAAEGQAVEQELFRDLRVARRVLSEEGGIRFGGPSVRWDAVNQFTKNTETVVLPGPRIGNVSVPINRDPMLRSPVVDDIADLMDVTATIFQRMNEQGDMIRVATTIVDEGERAVDTFIPAILPEGGVNPVISAVLGGENFTGRAFVVNSWFITAYGPLRDADGGISGMIYVGRPQAEAEKLIRDSIINTKIGETGYVYVLSGRGENRGRYIVSQNGIRDGEDVWNERDDEGRLVIQDIIRKALELAPGELGTVEYWWRNPGEPSPRLKIARIAYYAPWDWVIGTSAYEDELANFRNILEVGRKNMAAFMSVAGIAAALSGLALSLAAAGPILRPIIKLSRAAESLTRGNLDSRVSPEGPREVLELARAFNHMAERLKLTLSEVQAREQRYRSIFEGAVEGIFQSSVEGRVLSVNSALSGMLLYDSPEEFASSIRNIRTDVYVRSEDRDSIVSRILEKGYAIGVETQFRRKDGTHIWVSISARALRDDSGRTWGIEGFISDIDSRKRAEDSLKKSLAEKEELLREIHHRVNNNLQILASLVSLQSCTDEGSGEALKHFAARIQTMSLIHEIAYESESVRGISVTDLARALADYLFQAYRPCFGDIEVDVRGAGVELDLDRAIPCGLLMNEILSNAFRHAFPPPRQGAISIDCSINAAGDMVIEIEDNGTGFTQDHREGMGMKLIDLLSRQLSAEIKTTWKSGTKYSILIRSSRASNRRETKFSGDPSCPSSPCP